MTYTRKEFLQNSAILLAASMTSSSFILLKNKPLLAFSTIACPDWTLRQAIDFAALHNYNGLEIRGIKRQMNLPDAVEFNSPENMESTLATMKEKGLKFVNLGASAAFHMPEGAVRDKHMKEAKAFIDLAQQINCPFVRVFPNEFPKDQERDKTIAYVASGLRTLGEYAKKRNVTVLMETHGDFSHSDDVLKTMKAADHPNVALVWDISNMWTETKEAPAVVYKKLKKYIRHTHIKDAKLLTGDKLQYVFLGEGDVPIFEAIDILAKDGYKGYYSFEWEKLWHPEIAEPELALADYQKAMKKQFKF
ncbi:sugar phosphate isomerase/epimerase family protein [Daejeonella lutea]|uniref:Sugar phosphate isomerase/epimerase n=1 Tax=Daejeonella lutea TaxID=572036 RepID=A0A1T5A678_9SPHI|nr:sugar phosphate isomerase/epimerase family protein [Daejeonella lutea]SKB30440.1 Sugar phosphate isomerase/epimerase [Daejeonella lutea]